MTSTALVVPWRYTDDHRAAAWGHVRSHLEATYSWPIVVGVHDDGDWIKAKAVAAALAQTDADVLVIHDADVLLPDLRAAVAALDSAAWVVPHVMVHRLTEAATAHYLATGEDNGEREKGCPYPGQEGGGVTILRRETYERVPMDPRFVSWGGEDRAWADALNVLVSPPERLDQPLLHLWHPPMPGAHIPNRQTPHRAESHDLRFQYLSARRRHERDPRNPDGRERMEALVAEARHLTCGARAT